MYLVECGVENQHKTKTANFGIASRNLIGWGVGEEFTTAVPNEAVGLVVGMHNHSTTADDLFEFYLTNTTGYPWIWHGCTITPAKVK